MSLSSINPSPLVAKQVANILKAQKNDITIIDIGARSGAESYWDCYGESLKIIGFEPDKEECHQLNKQNKNKTYYPVAIHEKTGQKEFFITNSPSSSGFDEIDVEFSKRFPKTILTNGVASSVMLETTSLDDFVSNNNMNDISFIKIDVEGAELSVLKGAKKTLRDRNVLGVIVEVWWEHGLKKSPPFAELDSFLRSQGFHFFDLKLNYTPRSTMPAGKVQIKHNKNNSKRDIWQSPELLGQAMSGDAIYFRDPIRELNSESDAINWDDNNILKLVSLFDIFNYPDCGIELLNFYKKKFTVKVDIEELFDLFVPHINSQKISYGEYFDISKEILKQNLVECGINSNLDHIQKPFGSDQSSTNNYSTNRDKDNYISSGEKDLFLQNDIALLKENIRKSEIKLKNIINSRSWKFMIKLQNCYKLLRRIFRLSY